MVHRPKPRPIAESLYDVDCRHVVSKDAPCDDCLNPIPAILVTACGASRETKVRPDWTEHIVVIKGGPRTFRWNGGEKFEGKRVYREDTSCASCTEAESRLGEVDRELAIVRTQLGIARRQLRIVTEERDRLQKEIDDKRMSFQEAYATAVGRRIISADQDREKARQYLESFKRAVAAPEPFAALPDLRGKVSCPTCGKAIAAPLPQSSLCGDCYYTATMAAGLVDDLKELDTLAAGTRVAPERPCHRHPEVTIAPDEKGCWKCTAWGLP